MHFEPLDARTLFAAATGLDPSFGTKHGYLSLDRTAAATPGYPTITGGADIYAYSDDTAAGGRVYKLDTDGHVVTQWADDGHAGVSMFSRVDALAYERRTGDLYVAGVVAVDQKADDNVLTVLRLKSDGTPDSAFGDHGTTTYTPGKQQGQTVSLAVQQLLPLPRGQVLLGLTRTTNSAGPNGSKRQTGDAALMKFRADGSRDPSFGKHGATTLLTYGGGTADGVYAGTSLQIDALEEDASASVGQPNTFFAVLERTATADAKVGGVATPRKSFKSRTLSLNGVEDTSRASSWVLATTGGFHTILAADLPTHYYDDNGNVVTNDVVVLGTPQGSNRAHVYHLTPGQRSMAIETYTGPVDATTATGTIGSYSKFVLTDGQHIVRIDFEDLAIDRTFGVDGVASIGSDTGDNSVFSGLSITNLIADGTTGGVLARVGTPYLARFA